MKKLHPDQMGHARPYRPTRIRSLDPTPAELRILVFAAQGYTNAEIALRASYCLKSVKNNLYSLNILCGTATRTAMVIEAMRRGYVPCPHHCLPGHPPQRKPRPERRKQ